MERTSLLKSLLLLCALVVGCADVWAAADETITFSEKGYENAAEVTTVSGTNFTITFDKGTNSNAPKYYTSGTAIRAYGGNTMTVASTTKKFAKIEISFGSGDGSNTITTDVETYSNGTWTGSASSVVFTIGGTSGNRRISGVAVTYEGADARTPVSINSLTFSPTSLVVGGETSTATAAHNTPGCTTATFNYESLNPEIATCTPAGVITPVAKGTATIKATMSIPNDDPSYRTGTTTFTADIEVSNPSHTASFYVNGAKLSDTETEEGETIAFPSDPSAISGKSFVGWKKGSAIDGTTSVVPTVFTSDVMGDADVNYYAVFGTVTGSTPESWAEAALSSMTASDVFVFANGANAMKNDGGTSNAPGKVDITVSEGKITSTVSDDIKWQVSGNSSDGYTFYPSGSTTTWLYCNTTAATGSNNNIRVGTGDRKLWVFDTNGYLVTKDTYTSRYLSYYSSGPDFRSYINTGNNPFVPTFYKYIAAVKTYTDYCTTVIPGPSDPVDNGDETITLTTTDNMDGWRTFYDASQGYTADANTTVYVATANASDKVTLTDIGSKDIPAGTPVVLKTTAASHKMTLTKATVAAYTGANELKVTTAGTPVTDVYRLGYKAANGIGFYKYSAASPAAGIVYVENVTPASEYLPIDVEDADITTGISAIENGQWSMVNGQSMQVYNLNGQRVSQPTKGLYIVNGKKVIVK